MNEAQKLAQKVIETDMTSKNPKMQRIYEKQFDRWMNNLIEPTQGVHRVTCFGDSRKDAPKYIEIEGKKYTPKQIVKHVKARDDIGMAVLKKVDDYREKYPMWSAIKQSMPKLVKEMKNKKLDNVMMRCMCGQHNLTYRNFLEGIVEGDPESPFLSIGLSDAIVSLYKTPPENQFA